MSRCGHSLIALLPALLLSAFLARANEPYPDASRPWGGGEYVNFLFGHVNGHQALPHTRAAGPRAVFERLVDETNIVRIERADLPAAERMRQLGLIVSVAGEARAFYNMQVNMGEPLSGELVRVQLFGLSAIAAARRIKHQMPAWQGSESAWKTSLLGVAQSLGERNVYSAAERRQLAEGLAMLIPELGHLLSEEEALTLASGIRKLNQQETDQSLQQSQTRLVQALLALVN